jgi:hypothetical protein
VLSEKDDEAEQQARANRGPAMKAKGPEAGGNRSGNSREAASKKPSIPVAGRARAQGKVVREAGVLG